MSQGENLTKLSLLGPFRMEGTDGRRVEVRSKRGMALVAMLATSGSGERTRGWLQDRLWSTRSPEQASASLRRELSNLRKAINADAAILNSDNGRVWLDLDLIEIDVRQATLESRDEFLEGIDIPAEDMFEDWLRDERSALESNREMQGAAQSEPAGIEPAQTEPFSTRPAIAVLPFSCPANEPAQELVAQGISEDIIDRLSRLRWLPVIARSSSFALGTEPIDPKRAGELLGAQYVVSGSLREEAGGLVLRGELIDARNGQGIWSKKLPLPHEENAESLETLLTEITSALGIQVDHLEQVKALRKSESDLNINELIWRGRWHLNLLNDRDLQAAEKCFQEALAREPNSPEALIQCTWVKLWGLWVNRGSEEEIRAVRKMAQRAIIADYDDARGHMLAGIAEIWLRQPLLAESLLRRAIELNPSLVMAHAQLGSALHWKGAHQEAIAPLKFAIRLSPNDHDLFFIRGELAGAYLFSGDAQQALENAEKSLERRSAYWLAHVTKINALVRLGKAEEAQNAREELAALEGAFDPKFIDWLPFLDSEKRDVLRSGLNLPGQ